MPPRPPRFPPPPLPEDPHALSRVVVAEAMARGFAAAAVVRAERPASWDRFRAWLDAGLHGEMVWLERDAAARRRFDAILPYARSILAVAREVPPGGDGNVARYARGPDYHATVREELHAVGRALKRAAPRGTHVRVCVDTAPLLEREVALRAGLGFLGKNGLLIVPAVGSHVVLGALLTDVELAPTAGPVDDTLERCGGCTACLAACPTGAFVAPRLLDARLCLSYLSIEKRTPFTPEEERALEGRLFGCDVCQDVCPWNADPRWHLPVAEPPASLDPREAVALDDEGFRIRFSGSAVWRATREGLARNARAALAAEGAAS